MFILGYIDPGSGSLVFQMLIMGFLGFAFIFRKIFFIPIKMFKRIFTKKIKKEEKSNND